MIWLASYPRSGNTFFRNVLYEVYGLESSAYHQNPKRPLMPGYERYPVIKTHVLPEQLPAELQDRPVVYLIRDGRDALISTAHRRKDMVVNGSDFYVNLLFAILAKKDAFFGGWSHNVNAWTKRADLCIYFKDLIVDPLGELEKLRHIMPTLPTAQAERLPTFESLKSGKARYKGGRKADSSQKFFRSGKRGGWREEMPEELHLLFWDLHGEAMLAHGFTEGRPAALMDKGRRQVAEQVLTRIKARPDAPAILKLLTPAMPFLLQYGRRQSSGGVAKNFAYERGLLQLKTKLQRVLPHPVYAASERMVEALALPKLLHWIRQQISKYKLRKLNK